MRWLALQMHGETDGQIIAREPNYGLTQSLTGNKKTIEYIKLTYQYKREAITITDSYNLDYSLINASKLNKINTDSLPVKVKVKYSNKYPYESMVWVP